MNEKILCPSSEVLQENLGWLIDFLDTLAIILFHNPDDSNLGIRYISKGCEVLTGYSYTILTENRDTLIKKVVSPEYLPALYKGLNTLKNNKQEKSCEFEIITERGEKRWILALVMPIKTTKESRDYVVFFHDISEKKRIEHENIYLTTHDYSSGLYNRHYLSGFLNRIKEENLYPVSCLIANINGLSRINKTYGHEAGDRLIKMAGSLLKKYMNEGTIGACIGGDEFILVAPFSDYKKIVGISSSISRELERQNNSTTAEEKRLSMAIGYGTANSKKEGFFKAYEDAEKMMHYSKLLDQDSDAHGMLASLLTTLFEKSEETEEHCKRLAAYSIVIGTRLGLSEYDMYQLRLLALLHDIGKIAVADRILKKPSRLTEEERKIMNSHPLIGYRIAMTWSSFKEIAPYILAHHERWDGQGYPKGLKGNEIPLLSRILAVVDAYDVMTAGRIYRTPMEEKDAIVELKKYSGTQFDPAIVDVFLAALQDKNI